mgnify:CR=1 FL=1
MENIKAVIFDFGYTIYDPEKDQFMDGALETIQLLHKKGLKLALMSRTKDPEKRKEQIKKLGLEKYFNFIEALPIHGTKEFTPIIEKFGFKPAEFLVVGDRFTSEIKQGNIAGMNTARFLFGPEKDMNPTKDEEKHDYTISNLKEVLNLVKWQYLLQTKPKF